MVKVEYIFVNKDGTKTRELVSSSEPQQIKESVAVDIIEITRNVEPKITLAKDESDLLKKSDPIDIPKKKTVSSAKNENTPLISRNFTTVKKINSDKIPSDIKAFKKNFISSWFG